MLHCLCAVSGNCLSPSKVCEPLTRLYSHKTLQLEVGKTVYFRLNLATLSKGLTVVLHHFNSSLGVNLNYWPGTAHFQHLEGDKATDLVLAKKKR